MKSMDWLLVSLIIELEITPHNGQSRDIPNVQDAYLPIVRDLVSQISPRNKSLLIEARNVVELLGSEGTNL